LRCEGGFQGTLAGFTYAVFQALPLKMSLLKISTPTRVMVVVCPPDSAMEIPVIEFIKETENLAYDVKLQFSATLTDKDGDSASSTFDANLFANESGNAPFDFTLVGTTGQRDAFNVDLSTDQLLYQVSGFDAGAGQRDTLVPNGDPNAVVQSIDNTGADSICSEASVGSGTPSPMPSAT
jgi:hypothetical protein